MLASIKSAMCLSGKEVWGERERKSVGVLEDEVREDEVREDEGSTERSKRLVETAQTRLLYSEDTRVLLILVTGTL